MSQKIAEFKRLISHGVEGWINDLSISIWDILLQHQQAIGVLGDLMEIGAWHGKSAALLSVHARDNETLFIFDIETRSELVANVDQFQQALKAKIMLQKANSYTRITPAFCDGHYKSMRCIHIDGDHSEYGIYNDLDVVFKMISPLGIIIVDDFLNERFPQVSEVTFEFIAKHRRELCLLLAAGNKAYLVHPRFRDKYSAYLSGALDEQLKLRKIHATIYQGTNGGYECFGVKIV